LATIIQAIDNLKIHEEEKAMCRKINGAWDKDLTLKLITLKLFNWKNTDNGIFQIMIARSNEIIIVNYGILWSHVVVQYTAQKPVGRGFDSW
jgi:hypothetical protein